MHLRTRTALVGLIVSLLAALAGVFVALPAQAAANCPLHYWCGFADASWGGSHLSWSTGDQGGSNCTSLPADWKNRFSSVDNDTADTDHPIMFFRTTLCSGSHYTVNAGQEIASFPTDWDNAIVAFIY